MPKFIVSETMACWVTWRRVVEAADEAAAIEAFNEGEGEQMEGSPEIGDMLDHYDCRQEVIGTSPVGPIV